MRGDGGRVWPGGLVERSACGHAANCQSAQADHRSVAWSWSPHTHTHTLHTPYTHQHMLRGKHAAAGGDVNDTLAKVQAPTVKSS